MRKKILVCGALYLSVGIYYFRLSRVVYLGQYTRSGVCSFTMSSTEVIRMDILCADYDYGKSILLWSIPHEYIREYSIQLSVVSWINYVYK